MTSSDPSRPLDEEERLVPMRLQKFLARAGVASRRGSENLMSAGRVCVNGQVVTELGSKVDPACDVVTVDGVRVDIARGSVTLMLNKPAGYLTTMSDPFGRPCVASLVPVGQYPGLYPIGRLDKDTTGLLLFSTDGQLGNALLHPAHHVDKTYRACVEGVVSPRMARRLEEGIELEDGMTAPAQVSVERVSGEKSAHPRTQVAITIHEGRKRQVRRMFAALGTPVETLERVRFAHLTLDGLAQGAWRMLDGREVAQLRADAGLSRYNRDKGNNNSAAQEGRTDAGHRP